MSSTTKRTDSNRTERSHDTSISRRVSRHEKDLSRYLADKAFRSLMAEHNTKAGA